MIYVPHLNKCICPSLRAISVSPTNPWIQSGFRVFGNTAFTLGILHLTNFHFDVCQTFVWIILLSILYGLHCPVCAGVFTKVQISGAVRDKQNNRKWNYVSGSKLFCPLFLGKIYFRARYWPRISFGILISIFLMVFFSLNYLFRQKTMSGSSDWSKEVYSSYVKHL